MKNTQKLTNEQAETYLSTIDWVIQQYPLEKTRTIFEMSIDMCDWVCWENEDECGLLFDQFIDRRTVAPTANDEKEAE